MIDSLLVAANVAPADLDVVAFGCGPGSFTGVRIAAGIAQGISLARRIPVIPVSTLRVLAQTALASQPDVSGALATIQSRSDEVYCAGFRNSEGVCLPLTPEVVVPASEIELPAMMDSSWCLIGDGARYFADKLAQRGLRCATDASVLPSATALLMLAALEFDCGRVVDAAEALPIYLDTTPRWRKLVD